MSGHSPGNAPVQIRKYLAIFGLMLLATLMTAGASYIPFGNRSINVIVALCIAGFQAFLVLGHMMHLLSEKKMIYGVLAFTAIFLVCMFALTILAHHDLPGATAD
ncbi:MAG: cytochrome C oxidase subunit IV family protein [Verrucomicrobia bacterium]|jgi:caa(3)-type oxidase subunit IV|nr:cytochrome C oxidase subunit IV family protein [Verrucomicrobiota bacterium]